MIESIGQYYEVRPNGRRQFELFKERVVVKSKTPNADSVITIRLADLRPEPNLIRVRPKEFALAVRMFFGSILATLLAVALITFDFNTRVERMILFIPAGAFLFISLVIFSKTARKIEFTQFVSHHGKALLDVARCGPQRDRFDDFLDALINQIQANQPHPDKSDPFSPEL